MALFQELRAFDMVSTTSFVKVVVRGLQKNVGSILGLRDPQVFSKGRDGNRSQACNCMLQAWQSLRLPLERHRLQAPEFFPVIKAPHLGR